MKFVALTAVLLIVTAGVASPTVAAPAGGSAAIVEAKAIQSGFARESGREAYTPGHGIAFKPSDHVYIKSALAVDFTYRKATVTLPLYRGLSPQGKDVFYIITEASDFGIAQRMGVNYAPKLAKAIGSAGAQMVTLKDGIMQFKGSVDFSPSPAYQVVAGDPPTYFPPKAAD